MTAFSWSAPETFSRLQKAVDDLMPQLSPAEARTAQYLVLHEPDIGFETGASIARKVGVSEVTVSRLLRRLGFRGIAAVKRALQEDAAAGLLGSEELGRRLFAGGFGEALQKEARALHALSEQVHGPLWERLIDGAAECEHVYTTGFQTVRGAAEDFARRLALVRKNVHFVAAHDSALTEWISGPSEQETDRLLILIDVVPYSREAPILAEVCRHRRIALAVFTDEFNTWAREFTDLVFHVQTRNGLFLESTGTLTTALNLIVHAMAIRDPGATRQRIRAWQELVGAVQIFRGPQR
jgi:DNA-binding MurR/RpiR family transcriptional regulator